MGGKRTLGLQKRGSIWYIDKKIFGKRLCESTGTSSLDKAEKYLARRLEEIRLASVYGVRPKCSFMEAATTFLNENQHKKSLRSDAGRLRELAKYIGNLSIDAIHAN